QPTSDTMQTVAEQTRTDPVCGMTVGPDSAHHTEYRGQTWHFCSRHCQTRFEEKPDAWLDGARTRATADRKDRREDDYTCPMHPDVHRSEPGDCPECGMALEPATPRQQRVEYTCPMHPEVVQDAPGD